MPRSFCGAPPRPDSSGRTAATCWRRSRRSWKNCTRAEDQRRRTEEFGDILINLANYARYSGIDAEEALRLAAGKFRRRFEAVEDLSRDGGRPLGEMTIEQLLDLWARAKAQTAG